MAPPAFIDLTTSDHEEERADKPLKKLRVPPLGLFHTGPTPTPAFGGVRPDYRNSSTSSENATITHGSTQEQEVSTRSSNRHYKRNAQEAFGRSGVSELLHLTRETSDRYSNRPANGASTPGRTSINALLTQTSGDAENASQVRIEAPSKRLRPELRVEHNGHPLVSKPGPLKSLETSSPSSLSTLPSTGLGSTRIVRLRSPGPEGMLPAPLSLTQAACSPAPELVSLQARLEAEDPVVRPDSAGPVRQSIEVPDSADLTVPAPRHHTSNSRKFYSTKLSNRAGRPWTEAEVIMACYLSEVVRLHWNEIDKKMDRGYNTCNTKYTRVPTGLKNPQTKAQMRWPERKLAIDALLSSLDLNMEEMIEYLQKYIETNSLPKETADEYRRLQDLESTRSFARSSTLRDTSVASQTSREFQASASYNARKVIALRERRNVSEYFQQRAKATPDSVLTDFDPVGTERPYVLKMDVLTMPKEQRLQFDWTVEDEHGEEEQQEGRDGLYIQRKKPYLSVQERSVLGRAIRDEDTVALNWRNTTLHADFDATETDAIVQTARRVIRRSKISTSHETGYEALLKDALGHASKALLAAIVSTAAADARLRLRTRHSIKSFLSDTLTASLFSRSMRMYIDRKVTVPLSEQASYTHPLLQRQLGSRLQGYSRHSIPDALFDTMAVTRMFTGTSGDVGSIAWQPQTKNSKGMNFAAGSACLVDHNSMQYNQPNNLLLGDAEHDILHELPNHHTMRIKPQRGANATHSMHASQDPRLFETVSMVGFSRDGCMLFSVGYDQCLRAFDVNGNRASCIPVAANRHQSKIDLLAVNKHWDVLATGSQDLANGVRVFKYNSFKPDLHLSNNYWSLRARNMSERKIFPSALRWGAHSSVSQYLLAGFSSHADLENNATYGEICLWDVVKDVQIQIAPAAGNVFDCTWNLSTSQFAAACAAYGANNLNRGTKSLVRVFDALRDSGGLRWATRGLEMECPALDINDVLFNPYNDREVVAGATDGSVYVWDMRRPNDVLHCFKHGDPLMELDPDMPRETIDTGVRFCSWGNRASRLYTGSSDGILKIWDTRRATEDSLVRDVAVFNSGIMSGAFTDDFSRLLIGEVNGSINLLEVGADPKSMAEMDKFTLQPSEARDIKFNADVPEVSGTIAARKLVMDGHMEIRPICGHPRGQAVRGKAYDGPYDSSIDAVLLRESAQAFQLQMAVSSKQCTLRSCCAAGHHFANTEAEDSGRAQDRVPQAMRDAVKAESNCKRMPTTNLTCTHCDAPASVRGNDVPQAAMPLCERCCFGCLRCGMPCKKISPAVEKLVCGECQLTWDAGVLGYALNAADIGKFPSTKVNGGANVREEERDSISLDDGGSGPFSKLGDLLDVVQEYHHSLWKDQVPDEW